ncbi:N-acetylmuramoyl-L-alanine amidase [Streptomyces sp. NPDC002536]
MASATGAAAILLCLAAAAGAERAGWVGQEVQGPECPATLDCRFVPAAARNYQNATRPGNGIKIDTIVIHDVDASYNSAIATFQDPDSGLSAHYVIRSADGQITQMVPTGAVAFHAGNYWTNLHAIGIEHEGLATQGAAWYTPAMYHASATLVRYLAARFHIPLDRRHIIGHDNVPGPSRGDVAGMHWDPGPYWDWQRYLRLLHGEKPDATSAGMGSRGMPKVGAAVTIAPHFSRNNQTVQVCEQHATGQASGHVPAGACSAQTQPSNFLPVRTGPGHDAPLFPDPATAPAAPAGTHLIEDWGDTIVAGQQFVVADNQGAWTAIWFSGRKAWFFNPDGVHTRPVGPCLRIVRPKIGAGAVPVYGTAFPQPGEYPPGLRPSPQAPLGLYTIPQGQAYVATGLVKQADDFFISPPDTVVPGTGRYLAIQLNHRLALVNTDDVDLVRAQPACNGSRLLDGCFTTTGLALTRSRRQCQ